MKAGANSTAKPLGGHSHTGEQPQARSNARSEGETSWPPSLHEFVERAFSQCQNESDKNQTHKVLKEMISTAICSNSLWNTDWGTHPLPRYK